MGSLHAELAAGLSVGPDALTLPAAEVARIIQQLPMASHTRAASELLRALGMLCHPASYSVAEREQCLKLAHEPLRVLFSGVESQIAVESHPLPEAKAKMAETVQKLCRTFGDACCLAVHEATAPSGKVSMFARGRITNWLAEAEESLAAALLLAYQLYQTPPAGVWQRLHAAHGFAAERSLAKRESDVDGRSATLRDRYVAALLLAMSNPYAFQRNELPLVVDACRVLAPDAVLIDDAAAPSAVAVGGSDAGPGYLPHERAKPGDGTRSLDLAPVLAIVTAALDGSPLGAATLALKRRRGDALEIPRDIVERLAKAWRGGVERSAERLPATHLLDTVLGLHMVHQALAGGQGFDSFQRKLSGREIELSGHDAAAWIGGGADHTGLTVVPARVLDQSLGGYRLLWPPEQRVRVRIGELVGLASPTVADGGTAAWLVGIVRWLRSEASGEIHVGVELLARQARPAAVRGIDGRGVRGPVQRGLLLNGDNGGADLLVPKVGGRAYAGVEIGAPADRRQGRDALRGAQAEVAGMETLGTGYYRVSLVDSNAAAT